MKDYQEYYIREEHRAEALETLKNLQNDFTVEDKEDVLFDTFSFGIFACYANQVILFMNKDISFAATHLFIIHKYSNVYPENVVGYYFDSVVLKITSCWEYIFQILNQFWGIELISSSSARGALADIYQKQWELIETEEGYDLLCSDYSEEELREININLKKALTVLHADDFKKHIKKTGRFAITKELDEIMGLFNSAVCRELRRLRNEIAHGASSSFRIRVGGAKPLMPCEVLTVSSALSKDAVAIDLIKKNIDLLKNGIQILVNLIWNNVIPNSKANEDKQFFGVSLRCEKCKFNDAMVQEAYEIFKRHSPTEFLCPKCEEQLVIEEKVRMAELDYNTLLWNTERFETQLNRYARKKSERI